MEIRAQLLESPPSPGRTPVYVAAQQGHAAAVEALARLGADVNTASKWGLPLSIARHRGHSAAAAALERLGAR